MSSTPNPKSQNPFLSRLKNLRLVINTQKFLRSKTPWGVEGMTLYDVLRFFGLGLINGSVSIRAGSHASAV